MSLYKNLIVALKESHKVKSLKLKIKEEKLPFDLQVFPNLEELYLEAPDLKVLSDDLSGYQNMRVCEIVAPKLKNISCLFHLPKLEILKATSIPLNPLQLGLEFGLAPLRFLTLREAELQNIPSEFGEISTLEEINFSKNKLNCLPRSIKDLKKLKRINLDNNCFEKFPEMLAQLPSLKHVSLDNNLFSEEEKFRIQREFNLSVN